MAQPTITQTSLNAMTQGQAFSQTLSATADPPDTETFTVRHESTDGGVDTQELTLTVEEETVSGVTPYFEPDIESLANTAALQGASFVQEAIISSSNEFNLVTGLTGTPWGGTKAMERRWPIGSSHAGNGGGDTTGLRMTIGNAAVDQPQEIWVEFYINAFGFVNPASGPYGDKIIFLQDEDFNRWDPLQANFIDGQVSTQMGTGGNAGLGAGQIVWGLNFPNSTNPQVVYAVDDWAAVDQWFRVRFRAKMGPGVATGEFDAWVDDDLVMQDTGGLTTNEAGDYFRYIQIGANASAGVGAYQRFGGLKVYDSNPGW